MLGNTPWPRTAKGVPHWHVASIDLQQLQSLQPQPDLPSHGHLAFFISLVNHGLRGAVVHVAEPGPCTIPADLPSMFDLRLVSTRRFPAVGEDNGLFPRWPVTLHLLPETSDWQEVKAAVHAIGGEGWQTYLTTEAFAADLPNGCEPWLWDSAQRFAASLPRSENDLKQRRILLEKSIAREVENLEQSIELFPKRKDMTQAQIEEKLAEYRARVAEQEALLETLLGRGGDYAEFVNRIQTWAGAHDRWASFSQDDLVALKNALEQVKYNPFNNDNGPLGIFYDAKGGTYYKTEDMANETLRAMASARSDVFCLLPDSVQTALAQSINQPSDRDWHQMFGTGTDIQGENMFHADKHMLLQLAYDPIIDFGFGDMGVVQFWMYADDMKHGNWAKATITSAAN